MFLKRKAKERGMSISQTVRCPSLRNGSDAEVFKNNRVSGGGAGTKLVLRSAAEEDELDRLVSIYTKSDKLQ